MASHSGSTMTSPRSYVFDPTEQVRLSLIFENWKAIESKKSPLFSTMVQYSTKSLIPPSLPFVKQYLAAFGQTDNDVTQHQSEPIPIGPGGVDTTEKGFVGRQHDRILTSSRPSSAEKSWRQNGVTSAIAPELRNDYLWNGSSVSRVNEYARKRPLGGRTIPSFDADDVDSFLSNETDDPFNHLNDRTNYLNDTVSGECSGDVDDDDDSDVSAEVLMSITRRKSRRRPLPSYSERMRSNDDSVNDSDTDAMFLGSKDGDIIENGDITFVSLWKDREVTDTRRHVTDCVPTYENLICLQRDMNRPLLMYVPEPREVDRPTVGDCDVDDLSDLSDVETVSPPAGEEDDAEDNVDRATTVDTSVQTDFPPSPPEPPIALSLSQTSDDLIHEPKSSSVAMTNGSLIESPIFLKTPSTVTVCEGEMVEICCQLVTSYNELQCDVHWFRDSVDVHDMEDDDRCVLSRQNNVFTLQMYNTVKQDSGYYMCMAVSTQRQSTHRFLLAVTVNKRQDKSAPCFSHPLMEAISVVAGEAAELCCHVSSGYPQPQILWYRDGHRLQDGPEYTISQNCGKSRLIIHSTVTKRAAGTTMQFTVLARNVVGEITSSTMLSVVPSSKLISDDYSDNNSDGLAKPCDESKKQTTVEQKRDDDGLYPDCDHLMRIVQQIVNSRETQKLQQQQQLSKQKTADDTPLDPEANGIRADMGRDQTSPHLSQPLNLSIADHFSARVGNDVPETATFVEVDDYVDLHLTFQQFNALCEAGVVSTADLRQGRVKKSDLETVNRFLREMPVQPPSQNRLASANDVMTPDLDDGQTSMTVDCGLKRVDSKRYRRDYVINRVPGERAREVHQRTNGEKESVNTGSKPIEEKQEISLQRQPLTVSTVSRDALTGHHEDVIHDAIRQNGGEDSNNTDMNNNNLKKISYPKISLPSVKLLAEKFDNYQPTNLSRVYSLTGRQRMRNKPMSLPLPSRDRLQSDEGHHDQFRLADADMTIFRSQSGNDDVLVTSPASLDHQIGVSTEMRRIRNDFLSLDESALKCSDV